MLLLMYICALIYTQSDRHLLSLMLSKSTFSPGLMVEYACVPTDIYQKQRAKKVIKENVTGSRNLLEKVTFEAHEPDAEPFVGGRVALICNEGSCCVCDRNYLKVNNLGVSL